MDKLMSFIKDEKGETNFVSLIILLGVVIGAYFIFRPYLTQLVAWIVAQFS